MGIRTYGNFYTHLLHIICFLCVAGERTTIDQRNIKHLPYITGYNMILVCIYNQVVRIYQAMKPIMNVSTIYPMYVYNFHLIWHKFQGSSVMTNNKKWLELVEESKW